MVHFKTRRKLLGIFHSIPNLNELFSKRMQVRTVILINHGHGKKEERSKESLWHLPRDFAVCPSWIASTWPDVYGCRCPGATNRET